MANRPMAPHLQIWKWGPHMAVSILHRITGDGMVLVGLGVLLWWLGAMAAGPAAYATFETVMGSPLGMVVLVLAGLPYSAAPLLVRSMMADIGDEERLQSGVDKTGLLYAIVTGTVKLGYALAVGVFIVLGWMGFDPKTQTPAGDAALIGLYAFAPAGLGLLVAAIMLRYPLDANRVAEIQRQLAARDAATESRTPAAEADPHAVPNPALGPAE